MGIKITFFKKHEKKGRKTVFYEKKQEIEVSSEILEKIIDSETIKMIEEIKIIFKAE